MVSSPLSWEYPWTEQGRKTTPSLGQYRRVPCPPDRYRVQLDKRGGISQDRTGQVVLPCTLRSGYAAGGAPLVVTQNDYLVRV